MNSSLRFIAPFMTPLLTVPPSLVSCARARSGCQPLLLELAHVRDDRPPVRSRDRPAVRRHQSHSVGDDVEDLPVRVLQNLLVVEAGGGDVASLEQDPLALSPSVVARLAIDHVALTAPLLQRIVVGHRDRGYELPVRSLPGEEGRVFLQPVNRDRSWNWLAHGRAVEEESTGRLREDFRLVVHARVEMDRRTARRAASRAAAEDDNGRKSKRTDHAPPAEGHEVALSSSGFGLRTLER